VIRVDFDAQLRKNAGSITRGMRDGVARAAMQPQTLGSAIPARVNAVYPSSQASFETAAVIVEAVFLTRFVMENLSFHCANRCASSL
jgi:hypothetical protein